MSSEKKEALKSMESAWDARKEEALLASARDDAARLLADLDAARIDAEAAREALDDIDRSVQEIRRYSASADSSNSAIAFVGQRFRKAEELIEAARGNAASILPELAAVRSEAESAKALAAEFAEEEALDDTERYWHFCAECAAEAERDDY